MCPFFNLWQHQKVVLEVLTHHAGISILGYRAGGRDEIFHYSVSPPERLANYCVQIIDASTGKWIQTLAGLSPSLPALPAVP